VSLLVASTVAPYKFQKPREETESWLAHAEAWREAGHHFFLAAETNCHMVAGRFEQVSREWSVYDPLRARLRGLDATVWYFAVETDDRELTSGGRIVRICTGRNLAHEVFNRSPGRWEGILFLDTDVEPPADAPERLLEVDRQLVGFNVPTYCQDGPPVRQVDIDGGAWNTWLDDGLESKVRLASGREIDVTAARLTQHSVRPFPAGADVREHWNTAGALLVRPEAARRLRWRYDLSIGSTDDPCFQADAEELGYGMTWVRHDVVGQHHPGMVFPLEARGHDLRI
jgi:hypothetical protein